MLARRSGLVAAAFGAVVIEIALLTPAVRAQGVGGRSNPFRRGDVNADGAVGPADLIFLRRWLEGKDGRQPSCQDAADINDDGSCNLLDVDPLRTYLDLGQPGPGGLPPPGSLTCGPDRSTSLILPPCVYPPERCGPFEVDADPAAEISVRVPPFVRVGESLTATVVLHNAVFVEAWNLELQFAGFEVTGVRFDGTVADGAAAQCGGDDIAVNPSSFYFDPLEPGRVQVMTLLDRCLPSRLPPTGAGAGHELVHIDLRAIETGLDCGSGRISIDDTELVRIPVGNRLSVDGGTSLRPLVIPGEVAILHALTPGVTVTRTLTDASPFPNRGACFLVDEFGEEDLGRMVVVTLTDDDSADSNALYARWGGVPGPVDFDRAADRRALASQKLVLPLVRDDRLLVSVLANDLPGGQNDVSVRVDVVDLALVGLSPDRGARGSTATCSIRGGGFDDTTSFSLEPVDGGPGIAGTVSRLLASDRVEVSFALPSDAAELHDLVVEKPGGLRAEIAANFRTLAPDPSPRVEVEIVGPGRHRALLPQRLTLRYRNAGSAAVVAPLFKLVAPPDTELRLSGDDDYHQGELQVLGIHPGGVAGVLPPGAQVDVPIVFRTSAREAFEVQVLRLTDTERPIDWAKVAAPDGVSADDWATARDRLAEQHGRTWGEYRASLASDATRLTARGADASSVTTLSRYAVARALERPGGAILGRLCDDSGAPIAAAPVLALQGGDVRASAVTDSEGSFALQWLEQAQTYTLAVDDIDVGLPSFRVPADGDLYGVELTGGPLPDALEPACPDCEEDGLPLEPVAAPDDIFSIAATAPIDVVFPVDPNTKDGSLGEGEGNLIGRQDTIHYTISFENRPTAAAPAVSVMVEDVLTEELDLGKFRFGSVHFEGREVVPGRFEGHEVALDHVGGHEQLSGYSTARNSNRYAVRAEKLVATGAGDAVVAVSAHLDPGTRTVRWIFRTLDPHTRSPIYGADDGFLPAAAKGGVSFSVTAGKGEPGDEVKNKALIQFDKVDEFDEELQIETREVIHRIAPSFVRGAADDSRSVDVSDAMFILAYLFGRGDRPECSDAADVNDDGWLDVSDPVHLLRWLFAGGELPRPPSPGGDELLPHCGIDATVDDLDCTSFPACS